MDAAYRTPLVDCFRRGDVPRDLRLLAAAGGVAPRAHEQIALLILLAEDADAEVATVANTTLSRLPVGPLSAFLARSDVSADVKAFFAARGILPAEKAAETSDQPLLDEPSALPGSSAAATAHGDGDAAMAASQDSASDEEEPQRKGTSQRLAALSVSERVKVAMQGTREERSFLIRDPNRLVSSAVLSSPKLTESEVEAIARMANVSDEVLRVVGTTRNWIKNYNVISALTRNAKTPIAISLTLLNRLVERDIKMLAADRNIAEPVRVAARKMYVHNQTRRQ